MTWIFIQAPVVSPWRWRQQGPPKRWYPTTSLHGVNPEDQTWIFTAFKSSFGWHHRPRITFFCLHDFATYDVLCSQVAQRCTLPTKHWQPSQASVFHSPWSSAPTRRPPKLFGSRIHAS
jgi:hypothetical protein